MGSKKFEVDMAKISEVTEYGDLDGLSVKAYNQDDLESGLIEQVKQKEIDEISVEVSSINKHIKKVGLELDAVDKLSEAFTKKKGELQRLLKQKESKEMLLMNLSEDCHYLESFIENNDVNIENDNTSLEVANDDSDDNDKNYNKNSINTTNNNINNDGTKRTYNESFNLYDNIKKRRKIEFGNSKNNSSDGEEEEEDDEDYNDFDYDPEANVNNDEEEEEEEEYDNQLTNYDKRDTQTKRDRHTKNNTTKQIGKNKWGRDDQNFTKYLDRLESVLAELDEGHVRVKDGLKISSSVWNKLYPHQQSAVKWLWTLHQEKVGGILGDEMGLGKTIELLSFLSAVHTSQLIDSDFQTTNSFLSCKGLGNSLVVCPSTVMTQWVEEGRKWAPLFRVVVVHGGAGKEAGKDGVERENRFSGKKKSKKVENLLKQLFNGKQRVPLTSKLRHQPPLLVVTSYNTLLYHHQSFLSVMWHYVVLDEGHKVKNSETQISQVCRKFSTSHRIILSGSPLQNDLKELWALFDFVYPGKLGTKDDFCTHFNVPIVMGGYANSTDFQVQTSHRCAKVLKATIEPYLLRRTKKQVNHHVSLPGKSEQVLFCNLTSSQQDHYYNYLLSPQCKDILSGRMNPFPGIMMLRKICNHVKLVSRKNNNNNKRIIPKRRNSLLAKNRENKNITENKSSANDVEDADDVSVDDYLEGGGKMVVVDALLEVWRKQKHKVLLFSQSRKMLCILERFIASKNYTYVRMDGTSNVTSRQQTIQRFNKDDNIFLFLLTTKVGGLGVNLTAADRVIIYDPDWNPCTDIQARERAWRIGQSRDVCVYRLLTAGTIEEKIYHRQIFKQFLSNRIMCNSKQRRFFKLNHLKELFSLPQASDITETACLFVDSDVKLNKDKKKLDDEVEGGIDGNDTVCNRKNYDGFNEKICKNKENNGLNSNFDSEVAGSKVNDGGISAGDKEEGELMENDVTLLEDCADVNELLASHDEEVDERIKRMKEIARKISVKIATKKIDTNMKKNKKDKKIKKNEENVLVDGCAVGNVCRMEKYKEKKDKHKERKLLAKLFKKKGVHSALKHDKIMSNCYKDDKLVRLEAEAVAMEAVNMLRKSQEKLKKKRFGAKNNIESQEEDAKSSIKINSNNVKASCSVNDNAQNNTEDERVDENLPSSSKLLSHLKAMARVHVSSHIPDSNSNDEGATTSTTDAHNNDADNNFIGNIGENIDGDIENENNGDSSLKSRSNIFWEVDDKMVDLAKDIKKYMSDKRGWVSSEEIVDAFKNKLSNEQILTFKHLTKKLCHYKKSQGLGYYKLKVGA